MATSVDDIRELLTGENFATVLTINADGSTHPVVIWIDAEGDRVVVNGAAGRRWVENLRARPAVTTIVVDHAAPYRYAVIRGEVETLTTDGADEQIDRLAQRYFKVERYPNRGNGEQRVRIVIRPSRIRVRGGRGPARG